MKETEKVGPVRKGTARKSENFPNNSLTFLFVIFLKLPYSLYFF